MIKMAVPLAALAYCLLSFAEPAPKNAIGLIKARSIALKTFSGRIKSEELEREGKWIYSFDIVGKDGSIHEIGVNALTGAIEENKIETPAQEAQEQENK